MKKSILLFLLFSSLSYGGLPPTTSKDSADSSNITTFFYQFPNFTGTHTGVTFSLGVNSITGGGTGQTTANAAFNALSPMSSQYDLIIGGASGAATRLPKGANNTHLTTIAGVVAWTSDPTPYNVSTINSNTNAVAGSTYLCDTSGGAFTVTLPTPVAGAYVAIKDSTGSFGTNQLTIAQNAGEKIEGLAASKILYTSWGAFSFFSNGTDWFMGPF